MTSQRIENSDRGITLNKSLAWTIGSGLIAVGLYTGLNLATLTTRMDEVSRNSTDRGRLAFGPWAFGTAVSANSTIAHVYAVACYFRTFTDAEAAAHMAAMQKIAETRGVLFLPKRKGA